MPSRRLIIALIVAMLLIGDGPAFAQYFGRNKVQHREFDFKVAVNRALRCLLLPRAGSLRRPRRPHGRAVVRAAELALRHGAHLAPAAHPLREQRRLQADQYGVRRPRRGHGRRHRGPPPAHRHALGRVARRHRPRARPRTGARLPVRHGRCVVALGIRAHASAALDGRRARRVPLDRKRRSADRHVASRRRRQQHAPDRARTSATRASSRTGSATPSGRTSPGGGTTAPSCCCSTRR